MLNRQLILTMLFLGFAGHCLSQELRLPEGSKDSFLKRNPSAHILVDPDHYCWGMSVILWKDNKYHGYYARWPKHYGEAGWMTHCEIAHAVSDKPEGPFKTVGIAIQSRHMTGWDVVNAHNPAVCVAQGKIHLYYISNKLRGEYKATKQAPYPSNAWLKKNRKKIVRNRQCIGVATADNPEGPFIRLEKPVVEPDNIIFKNMAVNPAVVYQNGKFVMIAKGDDPHKKGWFRIQLVGHSDKAEGPFVFQKKPIYSKRQTEDACIWYDQTQKRYHCLIHIMGKRDLAHLISDDSYTWREAQPFVLVKKQFKLMKGEIWKPRRVERPYVLTNDKGKPQWLYLGVAEGDIWGNVSTRFPK